MVESIRVNFGRPMPVYPLPDAVLLPHAIHPDNVREPKYTRLVRDCLDGAGQVAVASFAPSGPKGGKPPALRPVVCVGQIIQHQPLANDQYDILLQGVCRAKITRMIAPGSSRPYHLAQLVPLEHFNGKPPAMTAIRRELRELLESPSLQHFKAVEHVIHWFDRSDISTHALLELIGFALVPDVELRYRLLAEASAERRAGMIKRELVNLDGLVRRADRQPYASWPRGMSWN
jgi:hypothetical protein